MIAYRLFGVNLRMFKLFESFESLMASQVRNQIAASLGKAEIIEKDHGLY